MNARAQVLEKCLHKFLSLPLVNILFDVMLTHAHEAS
jgi:hypothetical protein